VNEILPSLDIKTWKEESMSNLANEIQSISFRPLILIDGKAGCGKTSCAMKLADALDANIVSTDDVCWNADPIHWDYELQKGIIQPWINGENVSFTPSGWVKENRIGFIKVDSCKALIIEGSGACRKSLREIASYSICIATDPVVSRSRVIKRDLANGENGGTLKLVTEFTDWWDSAVDPFLLEEEAWKHVNIIISGSQSNLSYDMLLIHKLCED